MFPRKELRHEYASALAGEGVLSTPIYWTAIALFLLAEVLLALHTALLAVPPYRWLATAVSVAVRHGRSGSLETAIAELRAMDDRAQFAGDMDLLGVVIMFIAVGVVVYAGFNIMSTTIDLTDLQGDTNTSDSVNTPVDALAPHQENFTEDYGAMFGFIALILLVAFLAVIIIYLQVARGAGSNGGR